MKNITLLLFVVAVFLSACVSPIQSTPHVLQNPITIEQTPSPVSFDRSKLGGVDKDLTYCSMEGIDLKMDVYYPNRYSAQP